MARGGADGNSLTYESRNKSAGINLSIPIAGNGSISGNYAADKVDLAYQSVNEQTGLYAGQGGFDINVGGNTDLKGAVIASEASADQNRLTTNTLTYSDLQNRLDWEAEAQGFSLGLNTGPGLDPRGLMPGLPVDYDDSDHREGSTLSAVGVGTLTVRQDAQTGANSTAGLSRDTATANAGSVGNNFDQSAVQENIELSRTQAELASQLAPIVYKQIGNYATGRFEEGSIEKIALHALGGALVAAMAGGDITAGMGVAAANEWMIGQLHAYFEAHPELSADQRKAISLGASAVLGATLDGGQGAAIATNATQYNYLDHLQAQKLVGALKKCGKDDEACRQKALGEIQTDHKRNEEALQQACLVPNSAECVHHAQALLAGQEVLEQNALLVRSTGLLLNSGAGNGSNAYQTVQRLKNLNGWIDANCQGISPASCSQRLQAAQSKEEWIKNVILDFTPIVGDIKGFAEAETGSDYLWATIGLIPMAGDAVKAIAKADNVAAGGKVADGLEVVDDGVDATGTAGKIKIEPGAIPDANEVRAGQGLSGLGYDVTHQATASSKGIQGQRTADFHVDGLGFIDVYTPQNIDPKNIVRAIEKKSNQAGGVVVQADLPSTDMSSIAARMWGKTNAQSIKTIFFQKPDGSLIRFDRPAGGD